MRCSLCNSPHAPEIARGIRSGWNAGEFQRQMTKYGIKPDRRTFYSHKEHVLNPDPAFHAVQTTNEKRDIEVKKSSNQEFLEEIRDIALAKARMAPESVTIEQGLKAAGILEGRKQQSGDQINLLVQVVTGRGHSAYVVDGEAREVS